MPPAVIRLSPQGVPAVPVKRFRPRRRRRDKFYVRSTPLKVEYYFTKPRKWRRGHVTGVTRARKKIVGLKQLYTFSRAKATLFFEQQVALGGRKVVLRRYYRPQPRKQQKGIAYGALPWRSEKLMEFEPAPGDFRPSAPETLKDLKNAYAQAALDGTGFSELDPALVKDLNRDAAKFYKTYQNDIGSHRMKAAGQGFWIARNGGTAFGAWDSKRAYRLNFGAKQFGPYEVVVDDDGVAHGKLMENPVGVLAARRVYEGVSWIGMLGAAAGAFVGALYLARKMS